MSSAAAHDRFSQGASSVSDEHEGPLDPDLTAPRRGPGSDASLSDLISRLGDDVTLLFRQEVELAKVELRRDLMAMAKAGGMLAAAGLLAFVTLLLLAWTLAWGLATVLSTWLGFLIAAVVIGAIAAGIGLAGKKRFEQVDLTPRTTVQTLQEDREWLSERTTS
jgi:uncharacterized membrane protein YqjE